MNHIELPDYGENDPCTPNPVAYAQKAIFAVMCCGDWFTVRQLSRLAKVSDPRGNIRTMIERGYRFQKMWDTNEHGIRYKLYRLDMEQTRKNFEPKDTDKKDNQLNLFQ